MARGLRRAPGARDTYFGFWLGSQFLLFYKTSAATAKALCTLFLNVYKENFKSYSRHWPGSVLALDRRVQQGQATGLNPRVRDSGS